MRWSQLLVAAGVTVLSGCGGSPESDGRRVILPEDLVMLESEFPEGYTFSASAKRWTTIYRKPWGRHWAVVLEPGPIGYEILELYEPPGPHLPPTFKKSIPGWDVERRMWKTGKVYVSVWKAFPEQESGRAGFEAIAAWVAKKLGTDGARAEPPGP